MCQMLEYVCCCLCVISLQATWTPAEPISVTGEVCAPQIAVDRAGNATAVWKSFDGTHFIVQAKTKPIGGSWQDPENLSDDGQSADVPQIAVDGAGNATAVWKRYNGTHVIIQARTKPFGGSWQDPENLSDEGLDADLPQIAVDAAGNATAVWIISDGTSIIVQATTKLVDKSWQDPENLSDPVLNADMPQIAVGAAGNATAVWTIYDGTHYIVQAKTKPFGGSWQDLATLSDEGLDANVPQIAVNAAGNATAVWTIYDGTHSIVQAKTKPFGENWQDLATLSDEGQDAFEPQIAVSTAGNATAVWVYDGTHLIVQAKTKPVGESWQDLATLSDAEQDGDVPQIAVDAVGNATAVWVWYDGTNHIVQAKTKPVGGSWQENPDNLSDEGHDANVPHIAVDTAGNATAAWWTIYSVASGVIESSTQYAAPTVTSVVPAGGPPAGRTSVTITGNTFVGVTAVYFGSAPATSFTVVSPTEIIAIAPAGALGTVDIRIVAAGGSSPITDADRYQYAPKPSAPRHFRGTNKKRHHSHEHNYVLRTHWKASRSTNTSAYHIYKRKKIVAIIPSNSKRTFKTHLIWKHSWKKFSITAVTANNAESVHKKLKIEH